MSLAEPSFALTKPKSAQILLMSLTTSYKMLQRSLLAADPLDKTCSSGNSLAATIFPTVTSLNDRSASKAANEAGEDTQFDEEPTAGIEDGEELEE